MNTQKETTEGFVHYNGKLLPIVKRMKVNRPDWFHSRNRFYYIVVVRTPDNWYKIVVTRKNYTLPTKWQPKHLQREFKTVDDAVYSVEQWSRD